MSAIASIPSAQTHVQVEASTPGPADVLDAVLALSREAAFGSDEAAVADAIVRVSGALIGADQGTLGVVRDGEVITIAALLPPRQAVGSRFPVGFGVAGWVAATGQPAAIQDVRQDTRYVRLPYPEVRSFVCLPLRTGGQLVGILSLASWRPGAFGSATAEALAPFAEQAAILLRRAAVDQQLHERLHSLEQATREQLAETLHELKLPLHAAAGFVELVADGAAGPLNHQQRDFLSTARAECQRLKDALAELVESSARDARRPPQRRAVEPREVVATAVERQRGQALRRGLQLELEVNPDTQPVEADEAGLLQVLANFLQNALRLAPAGSEVVVSAAPYGEAQTCFAVADRGPGILAGQLETLFEPFEQGHAASRGEVGLGLAVSRRIVQEHGGQIWAEQRPNGGSRFCFALPALARA